MNFLKTVGNSIHSPQFYSTVTTKSFKQSFGYFFALILLLMVINIIALVNPLLIKAPKELQGFAQKLISCFPNDLEIKIKSGQAFVNKEEPYFTSSCPGILPGSLSDRDLIVIDTKTPYSPAKFEEYKVATWVTKDAIVYKKNDFETRSYSLTRIKDFKLNREVINTYYNLVTPYLKFVGPILLLLSLAGIYLLYISRLIHLLIIALLVWLLSKASKQNLSFGSSYKVGLHAITLGLIVDLIVNLTSRWTHFIGFPFMVTILTLAVVLVNLILPKKTATY